LWLLGFLDNDHLGLGWLGLGILRYRPGRAFRGGWRCGGEQGVPTIHAVIKIRLVIVSAFRAGIEWDKRLSAFLAKFKIRGIIGLTVLACRHVWIFLCIYFHCGEVQIGWKNVSNGVDSSLIELNIVIVASNFISSLVTLYLKIFIKHITNMKWIFTQPLPIRPKPRPPPPHSPTARLC
jgi:hypothetical protein